MFSVSSDHSFFGLKLLWLDDIKDEAVAVGKGGVDGVLGQCALAPCVGTAHAVDVEVDVQVDEAATVDFVGMAHTLQVFLAVVPSTNAEGLEACDFKR